MPAMGPPAETFDGHKQELQGTQRLAAACLVYGPLKDFGEVHSTNLGRLFVWRNIEETVARWSDWVGQGLRDC